MLPSHNKTILKPFGFLLLLLLLTNAGGCVASLSPLPAGKTLRKGQVRITTGVGMNIAPKLVTGLITEAANTARKLYEGDTKYTEEDGRRLVEIGALASLFHFIPLYELGFQVGVTGWLDLGARYAGGALEIAGQVQLFKKDRWSATAGLQLNWLSFSPSLAPGLNQVLKWANLTRFDISLPVVAGLELFAGSMLYAGLVYRSVILQMEGILQSATAQLAKTQLNTPVHTFGGLIGIRLGYRFIFAYLELGIHHAWWNPQVFNQPLQLSTLLFYPAMGLMVQFN